MSDYDELTDTSRPFRLAAVEQTASVTTCIRVRPVRSRLARLLMRLARWAGRVQGAMISYPNRDES